MAAKLLLVISMEFLISKVSSTYQEPYTASRYVMQDSRPQSLYKPNYQSYYPSYASKVTQPTYPRSAEVMTPLKRPSEYRQPIYQNAVEFSSQAVQRPVELRPPMYPTTLVNPTIQSAMEFRPQAYQKAVQFFSPATQKSVELRPTNRRAAESVIPTAQTPIEYHQPAYQIADELLSQSNLPMEFRKAYQHTPELMSPIIQTATEYYQPTYQKVAKFVASQNPTEYKHTTCDLTVPKLQSTQIPLSTSLAMESLKALTLPKSECPLLTSQAIESIKGLDFTESERLSPRSSTDTLDTNVLNNLAIALQLLIVNNIMNQPRESLGSKSKLSDSLLEFVNIPELPVSNSYSLASQSPCPMLNANFLGSSNYGDDGIMSKSMQGLGSIGSGIPLPRPGLNLMSPYDAIAAFSSSASPFSESTPSLFALKNNFQSPYAAIIAADSNKDLFSMSDLF